MAKNRLFSKKTRERWARMETPEYFEKEVLPSILDRNDIRSLSMSEIKGMKAYLRQEKKKIQREIDIVQGSGETFGMYESVNKAIEENLATRRLSNNPQQLLKEFYRHAMFFSEYETDDDMYYERSKGTFDHLLDDFNAEDAVEKITDMMDEDDQFASLVLQEQAANEGSGIDINDKWTILRRLAAINPRLNVDRAYASQTLKDIENMIESGRWNDINEITANFIESYKHETEIDKNWDTSLRSFEDIALSRSSGFHGVKKALRKAVNSIDNYEPVWASPFKIRKGTDLSHDLSVPF